MRLGPVHFTFLLCLVWVTPGCRSVDPAAHFVAETDRAPAEQRPKDWEQTKNLLNRKPPIAGSLAPDFSLPTLDGSQTIQRSLYQKGRPLVLIFGNYTCPPFRHHATEAQALYDKYRDRAAFLFVYVQEAHPADGWQMDSNESEGVVFNQPREAGQRQAIARQCCSNLNLSIPCVVDSIDNSVDNLYAGWPDRIFVIDSQDTIVYAGNQGPWGFKPKQAEKALRQLIKRPPSL